MARITVEDCLKKVNNRFALIHMVAKRVRQLRKGSEPTITSKNRDIVVSLREIAAGNIGEASGSDRANLLEQLEMLPENETSSENGKPEVDQSEVAESS
jgi:DNA-directed RNA polymerase subunit omega